MADCQLIKMFRTLIIDDEARMRDTLLKILNLVINKYRG